MRALMAIVSRDVQGALRRLSIREGGNVGCDYGAGDRTLGRGAIADITKSLVQKRQEARTNGDRFSDSLLKIVIK